MMSLPSDDFPISRLQLRRARFNVITPHRNRASHPFRALAVALDAGLGRLRGGKSRVLDCISTRNATLTTAWAELTWINSLSLAATFEGEVPDVTRSYAGKGTVRDVW